MRSSMFRFLSTFNETPPPAPTPTPQAQVPVVVVQSSAGDQLAVSEAKRKADEEAAARKVAEEKAAAAAAKLAEQEATIAALRAEAAAAKGSLEPLRAQVTQTAAEVEQLRKRAEEEALNSYRHQVMAAYAAQGFPCIEGMVRGSTREEIEASAKLAAEERRRIVASATGGSAAPSGFVTQPTSVTGVPQPVQPGAPPPAPNMTDAANIRDMTPAEYAKNRDEILKGLRGLGAPSGAWTLTPGAPTGAPPAPPAPQAAPQAAPRPAPTVQQAESAISSGAQIDHAAAVAAAQAAVAARRALPTIQTSN